MNKRETQLNDILVIQLICWTRGTYNSNTLTHINLDSLKDLQLSLGQKVIVRMLYISVYVHEIVVIWKLIIFSVFAIKLYTYKCIDSFFYGTLLIWGKNDIYRPILYFKVGGCLYTINLCIIMLDLSEQRF